MTDYDEAVRAAKVATLEEAIAAIEKYSEKELPSDSDVQMGVSGAIEAIHQQIASLYCKSKGEKQS
jgi:hypothetical protein